MVRIFNSTGRGDRQALLDAFKACSDEDLYLLATRFGESRHSRDQKHSVTATDNRPIRNAVGKVIWDRVDDGLIIQTAQHEIRRRDDLKRPWHERPVGIILLAVLASVITSWVLRKIGWI